MIPCVVLGDSIAVGVGQASPACSTVARVGIGSGTYLQSLFPLAPKVAGEVVISLGVNDGQAAHTLDNLRRLRAALQASSVVWLLPGQKPAVRAAIQAVAAEYRDRLIDTTPEAGPDHLHPTPSGYRQIAAAAEAPIPAPATFALSSPAQWLPPFPTSSHAGFQQGPRFRMWIPPGQPNLAFR